MHHRRTFFKYVIPSIIAFALSGVYAIIDAFLLEIPLVIWDYPLLIWPILLLP